MTREPGFFWQSDYLVGKLRADGKIDLYYVDAGFVWNDAEVWVGVLDPATMAVTREGGKVQVGFSEIKREVEGVNTTGNWAEWFSQFKDRSINTDSTNLKLRTAALDPTYANRAGELLPAMKMMAKEGIYFEATGAFSAISRAAMTAKAVQAENILAQSELAASPAATVALRSNDFAKLVNELNLSKNAQRALLREAMGSLGSGKIAHHLIPLEAIDKFKDLMVKAARGGFNINGKNNGILLDTLEHIGGHPGYNQIVLEQLGKIRRIADAARLSDAEIAEMLQEAADTLRNAISSTTFKPNF